MVKKKDQKRKMAESPALMAQAIRQRVVLPVLVQGVTLSPQVTIIPPSDFGLLNIDERYQRMRITNQVNTLITVIKSGGQIADPIHIAQRIDQTMWILDGQQRFWAHDETQTPLRAHIHQVNSLEAETKLFYALNARTKITARGIIKGWPGLSGELLRKMASDPRSPIFELVDFTNNSHLPLDATTVIKGMLSVTTGIVGNGDMATRILPRLDAALKVPGNIAWAEEFVRLLAAVFDMNKHAGRVRVLPVIALGRVAYKKYKAAGRPIYPRTTGRLRATNWDTMVPSHAQKYLPILEDEMMKKWKE